MRECQFRLKLIVDACSVYNGKVIITDNRFDSVLSLDSRINRPMMRSFEIIAIFRIEEREKKKNRSARSFNRVTIQSRTSTNVNIVDITFRIVPSL